MCLRRPDDEEHRAGEAPQQERDRDDAEALDRAGKGALLRREGLYASQVR
jgi:hypothetical protein